MGLFLALKVAKWPRKSKFSTKNMLILTIFRSFWSIFGIEKVVFWEFSKLFRNFLSIVFRYLYSLLPIADILLWGPADALHNEKSAGFWFIWKILPPLRHTQNRPVYWLVGWVGVFTFPNFFWEETRVFFLFFFNSLELSGGTISIFF